MSRVRLGSFLQEISIKTTENNQYPVLTSSKNGLYLQSDYFKKQVASKDNTGYKVIKRGQFTYRAMSDTGEFFPNLMECADIGIVSPAYPVFEINNTSEVFPQYLKYYFRSDGFQHSIASFAQGSTRTSVKFDKVKTVSIELPDPNRQGQIISILDKAEKVIKLRSQQLSALDTLIKARFVEMFGDIKTYVNITEIAHTYIGLVTTMTTHYCEKGTPLLFNSSVRADKIVWDGTYLDSEFAEANKSRMHKTNDIITVHTGDIGTSAVIGEDLNNSLGFATIVTRINDLVKYNPRYISGFLNYGFGKEQLSKYARDVRNNLNLKDFNRLIVPNASVQIQNEFAAFVAQVDKSKFVEILFITGGVYDQL